MVQTIKVKVRDDKTGEMVDGEVVKVTKADEPFSYITLEDGTTVTTRTTVLQVVRFVDRWDDKGNPRYSISLNGITTINSPETLRKEPSDGD